MNKRVVSGGVAPSMVPAFKFPNRQGYLPLTVKEMAEFAVKQGLEPGEEGAENFENLAQGYIKSVYTDYIDRCTGDRESEAKLRAYISETVFPIYLVPETVFGNRLAY